MKEEDDKSGLKFLQDFDILLHAGVVETHSKDQHCTKWEPQEHRQSRWCPVICWKWWWRGKRKQHYFSAIFNTSQIWSPADAFVPVFWQQQGTEGSGGEHFCRHQLSDSESHLLMEGGEYKRYHLMEHLKSLIIYNKNTISTANAWSQLPLQQLFFVPLP